jgi:hypothetical protein
VGAGVAVLAVVAVAAVIILSGGDDSSAPPKPNTVAPPASSANTGANGTSKARKAPAKVNRPRFTVSVLNGPTVTGLARSASNRVTQRGYKGGLVTTDTGNQARRATQVFYDTGDRAAALDVARILGVGSRAVAQMDQNAKALAGGAQVAVFIGADKAQ